MMMIIINNNNNNIIINNNNNNAAFIKHFTPKSLSALQRNNTKTKLKPNRKDIHNQKLRQGEQSIATKCNGKQICFQRGFELFNSL